ncbi:hypothetical protein BCR39DRAFT_507237 [Naematelia encephala]|uniref:Uncharacterized protein n=1 Tax=Naematelia encephala TaxID=71784 RepID=A0A1Y2AR78_9TREE|nr:hypothetical protein BCR39DRAFT_507237 [Naematelia encephala]
MRPSRPPTKPDRYRHRSAHSTTPTPSIPGTATTTAGRLNSTATSRPADCQSCVSSTHANESETSSPHSGRTVSIKNPKGTGPGVTSAGSNASPVNLTEARDDLIQEIQQSRVERSDLGAGHVGSSLARMLRDCGRALLQSTKKTRRSGTVIVPQSSSAQITPFSNESDSGVSLASQREESSQARSGDLQESMERVDAWRKKMGQTGTDE